MDRTTITRIIRDLITAGGLPCELVLVQEEPQTWRVTVRDAQRRHVSFDLPKGSPSQVREAARERLESLCS